MASVSLTVYEILKKTMCSGSHRSSASAAGLRLGKKIKVPRLGLNFSTIQTEEIKKQNFVMI